MAETVLLAVNVRLHCHYFIALVECDVEALGRLQTQDRIIELHADFVVNRIL